MNSGAARHRAGGQGQKAERTGQNKIREHEYELRVAFKIYPWGIMNIRINKPGGFINKPWRVEYLTLMPLSPLLPW